MSRGLAEACACSCFFGSYQRALHISILAFLVSLVRQVPTSECNCYLADGRSVREGVDRECQILARGVTSIMLRILSESRQCFSKSSCSVISSLHSSTFASTPRTLRGKSRLSRVSRGSPGGWSNQRFVLRNQLRPSIIASPPLAVEMAKAARRSPVLFFVVPPVPVAMTSQGCVTNDPAVQLVPDGSPLL